MGKEQDEDIFVGMSCMKHFWLSLNLKNHVKF